MRAIKTLSDVQIVLNQLNTQLSNFTSQSVNRNGLKFTGNGNATDPQDYVTLSQMQAAIAASATSSTTPGQQHFAIVFTEDGIVTTGMQIPAYFPSTERTGLPISVRVLAIGSPSGGNLTVNIYAGTTLNNGGPILSSDLIFPAGSSAIVTSSNFNNPISYFGTGTIIYPMITNGAGASAVTIEVIVKRSMNSGS